VSEGLGYIERVAALEASLLQANVKLEAMKLLLEECRAAIASVPDKIVFGVGGDGTTYWYLADELLSNIAAAQEEQRE
jgi:hypothetical protein